MNWIERFLEYCGGERGYSEHTVSAYRTDLGKFAAQAGKDLLKVTPDQIRSYMANSLAAGASPTTASRKLSAIRSFYQFVFMEGAIARNPARDIRKPKTPHVVVRPTTGEEVDLMLDSLSQDSTIGLRDRAIVYVAFGSGLRVSELVNLEISDLDLEHGVAKVCLGKGKKDRLVPVNPREISAIRVYLERARPKLHPKSDLLFVGRGGEQLSRQRIWQLLDNISRAALGRHVHPHAFRHAFVSDTINGGADIRVVQKMAGHASVNTTMRYLHCDPERLRAQYLKYHPRGVEPCDK